MSDANRCDPLNCPCVVQERPVGGCVNCFHFAGKSHKGSRCIHCGQGDGPMVTSDANEPASPATECQHEAFDIHHRCERCGCHVFGVLAVAREQIDDLKRERDRLSEQEAGKTKGILNAVWKFAEKECGHNPISARHGFTTIAEWVKAAKAQIAAKDAEIARLKREYAQLRDDVWGEPSPDESHDMTRRMAVDQCNYFDNFECSELKALRAAAAGKDARIDALQAFKDWVHAYLDNKGVPKEIPDEHLAAGCRIGGRMGWVFANLLVAREDAEAEEKKYAELAACIASIISGDRTPGDNTTFCILAMHMAREFGGDTQAWTEKVKQLAENDRLTALVAELRAGLEPFGRLKLKIDEYVADDVPTEILVCGWGETHAGPAVGDFRAAALLARPGPNAKE